MPQKNAKKFAMPITGHPVSPPVVTGSAPERHDVTFMVMHDRVKKGAVDLQKKMKGF
jgi:hypothetical protein